MIVKEEARYTKAVNIVFALGLVPFVMQFAVGFVFLILNEFFLIFLNKTYSGQIFFCQILCILFHILF